ncbi:MAG: hypothetical protein DRP93_03880 [Candidatus Neomarinimicrobiota bacterium]|nr:MAG: hypothetical protein DRP93_03880 [Candidatus Neomarinimicrobiota bacterium]
MKIAIYDPVTRKVTGSLTTKKLRNQQLAVLSGVSYVVLDDEVDVRGSTLDANDQPVFDPLVVPNIKTHDSGTINISSNPADIETYIDGLNTVSQLKDLLKVLAKNRFGRKYRIDMNRLNELTPEDLILFQDAINE